MSDPNEAPRATPAEEPEVEGHRLPIASPEDAPEVEGHILPSARIGLGAETDEPREAQRGGA